MPDITDLALQKMLELNKSIVYVGLERGGCAEFKYVFSFSVPEDVELFECKSIYIAIDKDNVPKLQDIVIDYESTIARKRFFVLENPYVMKKCSCGISFRGRKT